MALNLKSSDGRPAPQKPTVEESFYASNDYEEDFSDLEGNVIQETNSSLKEAKKARTANKSHSSSVSFSRATGRIVQLVLYAVLIIGIYMGGKYVYENFINKTKDITNLVKYTEREIEARLYLQLDEDSSKVSRVHQYSKNGKVSVNGNNDLSIVYIDDKQVGVMFNTDKYSMYHINIGDSEATAVRNMTYKYDDSIFILDESSGHLDEYFYYNTQNNDCILFLINNNSNRIVSMTYYTDFKKVTETLSFDKK